MESVESSMASLAEELNPEIDSMIRRLWNCVRRLGICIPALSGRRTWFCSAIALVIFCLARSASAAVSVTVPVAWGNTYTLEVTSGATNAFAYSNVIYVVTNVQYTFTYTANAAADWSVVIPANTGHSVTVSNITFSSSQAGTAVILGNVEFKHDKGSEVNCGAPVTVTVLKVELLHDIYGDLEALEDWPLSGSQLRSPKFIFGKEDGVFVRISGPAGLGNSFFKARVTSQSDATGVELDLREMSGGIYINSDADNELLYLADSTAEGSPADTIKVVEEEVLSVAILAGGSCSVCTKDVMVDRGEYAAAGDANWPGDTQKFKAEMVNTRVNWYEAGYNDAFGPASVGAFRTFIKSSGSGSSDHGEADMLYYTAHGDYDGTLYAHPPSSSSAILDGYDIANGSDWNNDLEWFYSDACSSLHNASQVGFLSGRSDDGYLGWTAALFGGPRPAHMVLGHWAPVNDQWSWKGWGNSQAICDDFFDHAAASSPDTIVNSWLHANTDLFADQECVVVAHAENVADQLKTVTRDTSSTAMKYFWYDPTGIGGTWHDTDFTKSFPSYSATETTIPDVTPLVSKRSMVSIPFLAQEPRGEYRRIKRIRHGAVSALLQSSSEIRDSTSAWTFLKGEISITQELAGISQVSIGTFSEGDFTWGENQFNNAPRVVGRLYKWTHNIDGVPVYGDEIALLVIEGRPTKLRACWHQEVDSLPVTSQRAVSPTSLVFVVRAVMQQASPPFEKITKTGMGYYTFQDAGKTSKHALPVWMFQVENATRKRTLYFDAMTGALIDSRRDLSAAASSQKQAGAP